ncbi:uncharacterized protein DS421_9g279740 [Arachis hypogaea]|nr:uncharacterized protein DS421_9g279740 [Arachis hypogaea]
MWPLPGLGPEFFNVLNTPFTGLFNGLDSDTEARRIRVRRKVTHTHLSGLVSMFESRIIIKVKAYYFLYCSSGLFIGNKNKTLCCYEIYYQRVCFIYYSQTM